MLYPIKEIDLITSSFDGQKYVWLSAVASHKMLVNLADKIKRAIKNGEVDKPEVLVGVAKGSLAYVKTLADLLDISDIEVIQIIHYTGIGKRLKKPVLVKGVSGLIKNKNVLLFDNLADSGKTLKMAVAYLGLTTQKEIATATLIYKPVSKFKPDFYVFETKAWVIFYHDVLETVRLLSSPWLSSGITEKEIKKRFLKIGMPKKEVGYAMDVVFRKEKDAKD